MLTERKTLRMKYQHWSVAMECVLDIGYKMIEIISEIALHGNLAHCQILSIIVNISIQSIGCR